MTPPSSILTPPSPPALLPRHLRIRPIRPADAAAHRRFIAGLSPDTRRARFNSPMRQLSAAQTRQFVEVDHHDRQALVAEIGCRPGRRRLIGIARYDLVRPGLAEVAVVVADDWQGRGVAGRLLEQLRPAALAAGVEQVTGQLSQNPRVWRLLHRLAGQATVRTFLGGETVFYSRLTPTPHHAHQASAPRHLAR